MSKYGTFADGSGSTTLDVPAISCAASSSCRPWRELADPSALSFPGGFADANHRARTNLARFADNYKLVFLVVLSVSLLWSNWSPSPFLLLAIVLPCFFVIRAKAFLVNLALTLFLLVLVGATASVLISLPVGILLVLVHAVLRLPVDNSVDEEAGRGSAAELPSTDC